MRTKFSELIEGVSFTAEPGQWVAVVGATGAGKTTVAELVPRLMDPDRGEVLVDGVPVREVRLAELRRAIGFVPQETFLFSDSLGANIALPDGELDASTLAAVEAAGGLAQFSADVRGFPEGWRTVVGERGITLSGGQKQRAAIARALVRLPRLLILDDAFSSVDTETEERILDAVLRAHPERTVLFVSHRLSTMRRADRILVFADGRLVESGTHEALMSSGGSYRRLIDRQLLVEELESEGA